VLSRQAAADPARRFLIGRDGIRAGAGGTSGLHSGPGHHRVRGVAAGAPGHHRCLESCWVLRIRPCNRCCSACARAALSDHGLLKISPSERCSPLRHSRQSIVSMARRPAYSTSASHHSVCTCHAANLLLRSLAILQLAGAAAQVRIALADILAPLQASPSHFMRRPCCEPNHAAARSPGLGSAPRTLSFTACAVINLLCVVLGGVGELRSIKAIFTYKRRASRDATQPVAEA